MSKTHTILMLACCLIGMGAAAAFFLFGVPANKILFGLMLLLCPLSHILMMRFMNHGDAGHAAQGHQHGEPAKELSRNVGDR